MSDKNSKIVAFNKGLNLDNLPEARPEGTYRFALNAINETDLGETTFLSNEESDRLYTRITPGYTPIGKCYIGNNQNAIFSVSRSNTISEIGILTNEEEYQVLVNDETSAQKEKLNFKVTNQIQAVFRLRRGCERTLYFVDGLNPVRYYNIDKPNSFQTAGSWNGDKFKLFRNPTSFPSVGNVKVLEGQGALTPGNYSILVQYLDEDFNGTLYLEVVNNIRIYNDSTESTYYSIQGSSAIDIDGAGAYKYEDTSKAISITLQNLDLDFPYVRFAFVHYTGGRGVVTDVRYTEVVSTANPTFIYTGKNASENGTIEDLQFTGEGIIERASHIEQHENRLILGETVGSSAKLNRLQKYASKIKTDCVVQEIVLTDIKDLHNPKNPLASYYGASYQPGEVYSFAVIYLFDDFTYSPAYHIPGKSPNVPSSRKYSIGSNIHPMSNQLNQNLSETYLNNNYCVDGNYWGRDAEGEKLENKPVRHHRFPTREELGIPFVSETNTSTGNTEFKIINLFLDGTVKSSITCEEDEQDCTPYNAPRFNLIVKYKVDGVDRSFNVYVNPDGNFTRSTDSSLILSTHAITDIKLYYVEEKDDPAQEIELLVPLTNGTSAPQENGLTYQVETTSFTQDGSIPHYTGTIFGVKFTDVEIPSEEEVGKKIIGYQIVRQERTDSDKTIIDSGVLFPMTQYEKFITTGLLNPELDSGATHFGVEKLISKDSVALLSPSHKFADVTYDNFTDITQVGNFIPTSVTKNAFQVQDIMEGSSADGINTNTATSDDDGYTLKHMLRYTQVKYEKASTNININKVGTRIYNLNALDYAENIKGDKSLYNLSSDNKILVLNRETPDIDAFPTKDIKFPYVYIKKNHSTFYQNFRNATYYSVSDKVFVGTSCEVFGGDVTITPMRYSNHLFLNVVAAVRQKKTSFLKAALGVLAVVVSAVIAIIAAPVGLAGLALASTLIGAGLLAVGGIAYGASAFIESAKFKEAYQDKWEQGLDKTVYDKYTHQSFVDPNLQKFEQIYYRDDTFNWLGEVVGDLWFESPMNISLRVPPRTHSNNYLLPLKPHMGNYENKVRAATRTFYESKSPRGARYADEDVPPEGDVANFFYNKLISYDSTANTNNKISYNGISLPIVYVMNMDFNVFSKVKAYYALPITYDGCSDCTEYFPHRIHYSEQSFQEERTDNFRTFLPNNYRDIEGETGKITNIFRFADNLYIHTEEALWFLPSSTQERVNNDIVTFIGSGNFFEVAPKKMIDDSTGASGGTKHKWSSIKTPEGYFFVSENQRKVFMFTGKNLVPISDEGLENWFEQNLEIVLDRNFKKLKKYDYPYNDNPSNVAGTGFISTYDTSKQRILLTKKDMVYKDEVLNPSNNFCINGSNITIFPNVENTIYNQQIQGWDYQGIENCRLKFTKEVEKTRTETRVEERIITVSADTIVVPFFDTTSMTGGTITNLSNTIDSWFTNFKANLNGGDNNLTLLNPGTWNRWGTEDWVDTPEILLNQIGPNKDVLMLVFVDESNGPGTYHGPIFTDPMAAPKTGYINDLNRFIDVIHPQFKSFKAINYPIQRASVEVKEYLQHTIAGIEARDMTQVEVDTLKKNANFTDTEWGILKNNLMNNPYKTLRRLKDYGWLYKEDRVDGIDNNITPECSETGYVISPCQFTLDIQALIEQYTEVEYVEVEVEVPYIEIEVEYIDGETYLVKDKVEFNNSWTISYSLKTKAWVSWHSYRPNFYIHIPNKFFTWTYGKDDIKVHDAKPGDYQTFDGVLYPFVVDFVAMSNPLSTTVSDSIMMQTIARTYNTDSGDYVEDRYITFNKAIFYNSRQCSGLLNLKVRSAEEDVDYLFDQVDESDKTTTIIDRTERDWFMNDFRDIRVDYSKPIWKKIITRESYIDKELDDSTLNYNKDWYELESFRDKFLSIRLIFDNFANKKLILKYLNNSDQPSLY